MIVPIGIGSMVLLSNFATIITFLGLITIKWLSTFTSVERYRVRYNFIDPVDNVA